ncbi:NAD(P)-dependent dehydrogenase (short-subunit alcohol dehydrogenase family) [Bradyrhizobium sp. LM3.6]
MKVAVIGGTGLIGSKTVAILRRGGDEVVAASRKAGVNTVAGQGLGGAMAGARVVIDVSNAPSFDTKAVREFFDAFRTQPTRGGGVGGRSPPCHSIHHRDQSGTQPSLLPRQSAQDKLVEAPGMRYEHSHDPVPGIPPRHCRGEY